MWATTIMAYAQFHVCDEIFCVVFSFSTLTIVTYMPLLSTKVLCNQQDGKQIPDHTVRILVHDINKRYTHTDDNVVKY